MNRFITIVDHLNRWILVVISILFGLISFLTLYQVFTRYVLSKPLIWSEEMARYLMIWIVLLGGAIALRKGLLISVEIVQHLFGKTIKRFLCIAVVLLNMVFLFILIKYGFGIMSNLSEQRTGAMDVPVSWTYAAIPIGSCLALLNAVVVLIELIFNRKKVSQDDGAAVL